MSKSTAHFRGVAQTDDLIVSYGRGNYITLELRPIYNEVADLFRELCGDLTEPSNESDEMVADAIIEDVTAPVVKFYQHWFDTYASLARGRSRAGRYRDMAQRCITYAFRELRKGTSDRKSLEDAIIEQWVYILTYS